MKSKNYFINENNYIKTLYGLKIPKIIYGTAWKKDKTKELVILAVFKGFRGIDTACQPKHYQEDQVGEALYILINEHKIERENLFIQTKFTSLNGQDLNRVPYDINSNLSDQVKQSIEKSLKNLQTTYIDSLLMHSPMKKLEENLEIWKIFEEYVKLGKIKQIGISNIYSIELLKYMWNNTEIKPSVIQNRFYSDSEYDKEIRKFCCENGIVYQSFWTLTANPNILNNQKTQEIAKSYNKTKEQIFFKYIMSLGIVPLTGTTNEYHMKEDLEILDMDELNNEELEHFNKFI